MGVLLCNHLRIVSLFHDISAYRASKLKIPKLVASFINEFIIFVEKGTGKSKKFFLMDRGTASFFSSYTGLHVHNIYFEFVTLYYLNFLQNVLSELKKCKLFGIPFLSRLLDKREKRVPHTDF